MLAQWHFPFIPKKFCWDILIHNPNLNFMSEFFLPTFCWSLVSVKDLCPSCVFRRIASVIVWTGARGHRNDFQKFSLGYLCIWNMDVLFGQFRPFYHLLEESQSSYMNKEQWDEFWLYVLTIWSLLLALLLMGNRNSLMIISVQIQFKAEHFITKD